VYFKDYYTDMSHSLAVPFYDIGDIGMMDFHTDLQDKMWMKNLHVVFHTWQPELVRGSRGSQFFIL